MAKNRTELINAVNTQIQPTVTTAIHRAVLNDELIDSGVFRKDVIASETVSGGAVTVDFNNKDLATITAPDNLTVSFSNLENGDINKYVAITKLAGKTISFTSATDTSLRKSFINASSGLIIYRIECKNNIVSVCSVNINNDIDTALQYISNSLQNPTPLNGWVINNSISGDGLNYFKDQFGNLRLVGTFSGLTASSIQVFILPSGYRPTKAIDVPVSYNPTLGWAYCTVYPDGNFYCSGVYNNSFVINAFIPKEFLA